LRCSTQKAIGGVRRRVQTAVALSINSGARARCGRVGLSVRALALPIGLATVLAASALAAPSIAEARITKIQITSPPKTIAFGGHSFPGIGQYEVITGIATGEVDPKNPQNSLIPDIGLAPKLPNGNVQFQHNFYILKPLDDRFRETAQSQL
jgi:hypothetical protein